MASKKMVSPHFSLSEIECHCGCGQKKIDKKLIDMAEALRNYIGMPMITHCVNRCKFHNARVGGVPSSQHIKGTAMDFHVKGMKNKKLHKLCKKLWKKKDILIGGLGLYDWGVHIDSARYRRW